MNRSNRIDHIRLTSHPDPNAKIRFPIHWGRQAPTLVLSAKTGWPSRIQFTNGKLTPQQKQKAQSAFDAVFSHYCPGKQAPRLPQRR
jgi:hypothetical protein